MNFKDLMPIVIPYNFSDNPANDVNAYHDELAKRERAIEKRRQELHNDFGTYLQALQDAPLAKENMGLIELAFRARKQGDILQEGIFLDKLLTKYIDEMAEDV